jgi:fructose-1,6-bisphosphatase/inositol monophosphatase family enzyme
MENIIAPLPLPTNEGIPNAKLSFTLNEDGTWNKTLITTDGVVMVEIKNVVLFEENNNKEHFDDWENQINEFGIENRIFGSSLFNLTLAANGVMEYKSSTKGVRFWDIAPALAIALEKNMEVVINGEPYVGQILDPNSRFVTTIRTK